MSWGDLERLTPVIRPDPPGCGSTWLLVEPHGQAPPAFSRSAICGHVFCSFLVLKRDLLGRMEKAGIKAEWDDMLRDLRTLAETVLTHEGKRFAVPSRPAGVAGKIFQCLRIRLPSVVRRLDDEGSTHPHQEPRIDAA